MITVAHDDDIDRSGYDDEKIVGDIAEAVERYLRLARAGQHRETVELPSRRVLLVDQDVIGAGLLSAFLALHGLAVLAVSRCEDVVRSTRDFQPDIVIIDLLVDHGKGMELAGMIREAGFADVPIVAISATPALLSVAAVY